MSEACSSPLLSSGHHGRVDSAYEGLARGLVDLSPSLQQSPLSLDAVYAPASDLSSLGLGSSASAYTAADLLRTQQPAHDPLQQLATLQQQQQLAQVLAADPLLSLSGLLAAQQGLSARVQELLLLKQQLQQGVSPRHGSGGIRGTGPVNNPLYKTELCRSWEETGNCRYGTKCQFAHGREELRPVVRHPKYKTEICRTFAQNGTCPYGTRCRFIHTTAPCSLGPSPANGAACYGGASMYNGSTTPNSGCCTPLQSAAEAPLSPLLGLPTSTPFSPALLPDNAYHASPIGTGWLPSTFRATTTTTPTSTPTWMGAGSLAAGTGTSASLAATPTAATTPTGFGGCESLGAFAPPTPAPAASNPSHANVLAALTALLGATTPADGPPQLSPASLTTAAATASTVGIGMGVSGGLVAAPAGLRSIEVGTNLSPLGQQLPTCPTTPLGTAIPPRHSISESDASTPNGSSKRLPFFEQLIHEKGAASPASYTPPLQLQ